MAARSIWKGNISFGLVNIPVQVFSAVQREDYTTFDQLCKKEHKIKYKRWCPVEEREVPWSEIKMTMWSWRRKTLRSSSNQPKP